MKMTIKIAVLMDPIDKITPYKDTSLAMLLAAQRKEWELFYMEMADLYLEQGRAFARMQRLQVKDNTENWFELSDSQDRWLGDMDVILMRKDPPVDSEFIFATHILDAAEREGVWVINKPSSLRDCNEKLFATHFPQCCPPVLVSRDQSRLKSFHEVHQDVIFKPLDGMGGASIFRAKPEDSNLNVILEVLTGKGQHQIMAQKYLPEIKAGDKRILMIDGEPVPFALARIPVKGETRGNLAAGGTGKGRPLTDRDHWICEQVAPELKRRGLYFVGLDVIGEYLTEINITSPTCVRELDTQFGLDIAGQLMDFIEYKLNERKQK
jgi:glutathione synthase